MRVWKSRRGLYREIKAGDCSTLIYSSSTLPAHHTTISIFQITSMKTCVIILVTLGLFNHSMALPQSYQPDPYASGEPAQYNYNWEVVAPEFDNDYRQQESRDGNNVQGEYSVLLPDGRVQRVTYTVSGDSGFVADVTYEGEARAYNGQSGGGGFGRGSGGGGRGAGFGGSGGGRGGGFASSGFASSALTDQVVYN